MLALSSGPKIVDEAIPRHMNRNEGTENAVGSALDISPVRSKSVVSLGIALIHVDRHHAHTKMAFSSLFKIVKKIKKIGSLAGGVPLCGLEKG